MRSHQINANTTLIAFEDFQQKSEWAVGERSFTLALLDHSQLVAEVFGLVDRDYADEAAVPDDELVLEFMHRLELALFYPEEVNARIGSEADAKLWMDALRSLNNDNVGRSL